ncbi:ectonucleoside triphosphate diphosphohydrolase 8-like [Ambystoma mexicanum]|uniref:ectonucleoside triphosphate diphosphohydrolase 8-like n=1 Tax=Ambystoma mexicanum TaxID=8296 RepID=UPI0037E9B2F0
MKACLLRLNIRYFLALIFLLAVWMAFLVTLSVKTAYLPPGRKYGIVFDAGSVHTALYVYQWPADKENDTGIVSQDYMCRRLGGISSYADDPAKAGESLKDCLDKAMEIIPSNQQKETPILLGATAGMRLLREKNPTKAEQVLAEVSKTLRTYPLDFQGARILSGNEEGSLGWITTNYLLESFVKFSFAGDWVHPVSAEIAGAMDLGGASAEMTFHPSGPITDKGSAMEFRLYGYNYTVYTHSYLCYGLFEALDQLMAEVLEAQKFTNVTHPCYPQGFQKNVSLTDLYSNQCVAAPAQSPPKGNISVEGAGDPGKCREAMQRIFNFSACEKKPDCTFDGVYQPPVNGQFYAFSAFYTIFKFLNLTDGQPLEVVNSTIREFCNKTWTELVKQFPAADKTYLPGYCQASTYILTLLTDGFKFDGQTWKNINFRKQAGSADIGWTLGYMLNLTNKIPSEAPLSVTGHDYTMWVIIVVVSFSAALLVLFTFVLVCIQKPVSTYETLM